MADYDFGSLATPTKTPAAAPAAPAKSYDFGSMATPVATPKAAKGSAMPVEAPVDAAKPKMGAGEIAKNVAFGPGEAVLNFATSLLAKPLSDVAGLAATAKEMISPSDQPDAGGFKNYVQNALTYQPRTQLGQMAAENNPIALVGKGIGKVADAAGNAVGGDTSADSARGMAGNFVREGLPQAVGFAIPSAKGLIAKRVASKEAALATEAADNAPRDANVAAAREQGYVLPPSVAGVKGPLSNFFSGVAGGTKLDYGASLKNQKVTNSIVKQELGHAADEAVSIKSLDKIREKYSQPYEDVKKAVPTLEVTPEFKAALQNPNSKFAKARAEFPDYFKNAEIETMVNDLTKKNFSSTAALEMQKVLRRDGYSNMKAFDTPAKQSLGEAQLNAARAIDDLIDQNLAKQAPPGVKNFQSKLATSLQEARKKIAQTYAVQGALNEATGNISAKALGKLWEKEGTLTGGLKDVAKTHKAFEKQMRDVDKLPGTAHEGVSNMDIGKGIIMHGLDKGTFGAASALGRMAAKPALLSDWYQMMNVKPPMYEVGRGLRTLEQLSQNPAPMFGIPRPPPEEQQDEN